MKNWVKIYNSQDFYTKKVTFSPDGSKIAILLKYNIGATSNSRIYTMMAVDGTSLNHH